MNLPDDWDSHWATCPKCRKQYHQSGTDGCGCVQAEPPDDATEEDLLFVFRDAILRSGGRTGGIKLTGSEDGELFRLCRAIMWDPYFDRTDDSEMGSSNLNKAAESYLSDFLRDWNTPDTTIEEIEKHL